MSSRQLLVFVTVCQCVCVAVSPLSGLRSLFQRNNNYLMCAIICLVISDGIKECGATLQLVGVCLQSIPLDGLELVPAVQSLDIVQNGLQQVSVLLQRCVALSQFF